MGRDRSARKAIPGRMLAWAFLPFAVPVGLALILVLGTPFPREIAPGSGLKLAGLVATLLTAMAAWRIAVAGVADPAARRLGAAFALMVGLFAWPVWSVGVLPSVNGALLQDRRTVEMLVERTEATKQRRSRALNHWVWLVPPEGETGLVRGRIFIDAQTYERLSAGIGAPVRVDLATGLLGAVVVDAVR